MIRVVLPAPLKSLAGLGGELEVMVPGEPSTAAVLDVIEARYPMLRGTLRDRTSGKRRAFVRFYACETDLSHVPMTERLPEPVVTGREPLVILGAMAGG